MLESDNTGLLTLVGGNDTQWWMSLQPLRGQPMLQTLGQDFMYLREAGRCMGKEEKFSSTGVGNWKKHSSAFLITNSRGKPFPLWAEQGGN